MHWPNAMDESHLTLAGVYCDQPDLLRLGLARAQVKSGRAARQEVLPGHRRLPHPPRGLLHPRADGQRQGLEILAGT